MADRSIISLASGIQEMLACRVLERYGIKTIDDLSQFISDNREGWVDLVERFRGMGPTKINAVREMVSRAKLADN